MSSVVITVYVVHKLLHELVHKITPKAAQDAPSYIMLMHDIVHKSLRTFHEPL